MFFSLKPDSNKSNWFSSLRRQPKSKKSALDADGLTQKSCVDLTTNGLYNSSVPSHSLDVAGSNTGPASINNTTGQRAVCTCEWVKVTPTSSLFPDSIDPQRGSSSTTTATITTTVSRSLRDNDYNPLPTASSEDNLLNDRTNEFQDLNLSVVGNTNSLRRRPRRKEQVYTSTTVTTLTKTTVVNKQKSYRVGLIFSDNGELLNSNLDLRQLLEESKQAQSNSCESSSGNSSVSKEEINNNTNRKSDTSRGQFSIMDDSSFDFIDDSADLFNRNYSGNSAVVHANSVNSTPKVLRKCNNCKNKSNLVYKRSVSSPQRKKVTLIEMTPLF